MADISEIRVNVSADLVSRASPFRSIEGGRYYLHGIFVHPAKAGGVMVVATHGCALVVLHDKEGFASHPVIINPDKAMLAWAKKAPEKRKTSWRLPPAVPVIGPKRVVMRDGELFGLYHSHITEDFAFETKDIEVRQWRETWIDGQFPEYKRVVPKGGELVAPVFDGVSAMYLMDCAKALCGGEGYGISIRQVKNEALEPLFVTSGSSEISGFCIVMPVRIGAN